MTFQLRPTTASRLAWIALAFGALSLQGCANKAPSPPATRLFSADFANGAKSCTAAPPALKDNQVVPSSMSVGNDGGWCGVTVAKGGKPYDAGLLTDRPAHGRVFVHSVGDNTRIDYTPDRGFTGSDSFTVKLLPGNTGVRTNVTVTGS